MLNEGTTQSYIEFNKFVKSLATRLIQSIVQSRMGEKLNQDCSTCPQLTDWFNLKIDEIGEIATYLKKNVQLYPPKIDRINLEFFLYTCDHETLPLETWALYVDSSKIDNATNVQTELYHKMGNLLKSAISASRVLPAFRYYARNQSHDTFVILYRVSSGHCDTGCLGDNSKTHTLGELGSPYGSVCLDVHYRTKMELSIIHDSPHRNEVDEAAIVMEANTIEKDHNLDPHMNIVPRKGSVVVATSPMSEYANIYGTSPSSGDNFACQTPPREQTKFCLGHSHSSSEDSFSNFKPQDSISEEALASIIFSTSTTQISGNLFGHNLKPRTRHNSLPFENLLSDAYVHGSNKSNQHLPSLAEGTTLTASKSTLSLGLIKKQTAPPTLKHSSTIPCRVNSLCGSSPPKQLTGLRGQIIFRRGDKPIASSPLVDDVFVGSIEDDLKDTASNKEKMEESDESYVQIFPSHAPETLGDDLYDFVKEFKAAPDELPSFSPPDSAVLTNIILKMNNTQTEFEPTASYDNIQSFDMEARQAVLFGDFNTLKNSIDNKQISPNSADADDCTLLHWAAINNRLRIAKYLIDKNCTIDIIGGVLSSTPLQWAARQGHAKMVALLVKNGADPSLKNGEGFSAIHVAAQFGCTPVVAYLLAKGVPPDVRDDATMTPIMWAAYKTEDLDLLKMMVTMGANINLVDVPYGNTCLHWAVENGNRKAVEYLVTLNSDLTKMNKNRDTVLSIAKRKMDPNIIKIIEMAMRQKGLLKYTISQRFKENDKVVQQERCNMIVETFEDDNYCGNFCTTCLIIRPHRSKHCKYCNYCIVRFDHHCGWIGNCIGVTNHIYFITYLLLLIFNLCLFIVGSIYCVS
uniref:Multifunctional fusion protein Palmitoyltransferase Autophagy-related protein 13 n=1 Tax=Rhabditophanes sp. KR3021 TaxID=114890 RepID=A0AC35U580_9BILA